MKVTTYFVATSYITAAFYSLPVITDTMPKDCDSIEVTIINVNASEIARTLYGKYFIIGSDITFYDSKGLIRDISNGMLHLVLSCYHEHCEESKCEYH